MVLGDGQRQSQPRAPKERSCRLRQQDPVREAAEGREEGKAVAAMAAGEAADGEEAAAVGSPVAAAEGGEMGEGEGAAAE